MTLRHGGLRAAARSAIPAFNIWSKQMSDSERVIRARMAHLTELLTELEGEDARMKLLMHDHYERFDHLEQEQAND